MRLAFYLDHYYNARFHYRQPQAGPATSDGPSTAVRGLTQAMARHGSRLTIIAHGPERVTFQDGLVEVQVFPRPTRAVPFTVSRDLLRWLRKTAPALDAIVLNGMFLPDLVPLARTATRLGLPYIVEPHDPYHPVVFAKGRLRKRFYWAAVERRILQGSAAIQVLSSTHREHLRRLGIARPVITIGNGFDERLVALLPTPWRAADNTVTIGYLGRMDAWHKGLDVLLQGVATARMRLPELRLVMQGPDWGDAARLRALASSLGLDDIVTFRTPDPSPATTIIGGWDALIAPSRFDGFPLTVVEAMLAERPVICSVEAGVIEHVDRAGCGIGIIPTAEGVADGIARLLARRDEWPTMGTSGRSYAMTNLTWDSIGESAARSYETVIDALRRDRPAPEQHVTTDTAERPA